MDIALDRLRAVHVELWNPRMQMVRMAPGTTPGIDLSSLDLHVVRETALGAYLDLHDGEVKRAREAIAAVLANQYDAAGTAWHGTFRVTAEQADPPGDDAVEWLHYDPNWRQFLGVILALCVEDFGPSVGDELTDRIISSLALAVEGEPLERIPEWYTNPNLMHAWLQAWVSSQTGSPELAALGLDRAELIGGRLDRFGDVDEYNSPTYDGIDLFAAAVWAAHPPNPLFRVRGQQIIKTIGGRLGSLYSREMGVVCGPHIRAYGLDLSRYVSLVGMWLALAGESIDRVLPPQLDVDTVHVHDLYFLPLFDHLADRVTPHVVWSPESVRRHEQQFGEVTATSAITPSVALGAEHGRQHEFARDQYFPLTVHAKGDDGALAWVGMKLTGSVEAFDADVTDSRTIDATVRARPGAAEVQVFTLSSDEGTLSDSTLVIGPIALMFSEPARSADGEPTPSGYSRRIIFAATSVEVRAQVVGKN